MLHPSAGRTPNLFIVGAPKSGTTSLYEWLRGHPDVFMSPFKEPCYFARDLALETSGYYLKHGLDRDRYLSLFADARDQRRLGEASTRYLYSRDAPGLIAAESTDPRIVVVLRNPIDMIASLHAHKVAAGTEDLADLEQALAAEGDRHEGRRIPRDSNPRLSTYRDRARFGEQLERWLEVFGPDRIQVLIFEEMIASPAAHFRSLLEFLDVDATYEPDTFAAHNPSHESRSRLVGMIARGRPAQFVFWRLLPRLLGDAGTLALSRRLVQSRVVRRDGDAKRAVPDELRHRLEAELRSDVERLSALLSRDLVGFWFSRDGTA